jgi:serine protease
MRAVSVVVLALACATMSTRALATPAVATPAVASSTTKAAPQWGPRHRVPGQALVRLRADKAGAALPSSTLKQIAARTGLQVRLVRQAALGWLLVDVAEPGVRPDEDATVGLVARLAKDPAVVDVSENKWMHALAVANDARRGEMWNLDIIGANSAWDVTQGTTSQRIGIVDTGLLRTHEDVGAKGIAGYDFVSNDPVDCNGDGVADVLRANDGDDRDPDFTDPGDGFGGPDSFHGTHVAGTIAAQTNNGLGVSGINWNAKLVIARALGRCGGDLADIIDAVTWLAGVQVPGVPSVGANKVSVINLSLGSDGACGAAEQSAVDAVNAAGVVFVAAAGNSSSNNFQAPVGSPANCSGVVTVAAHERNRNLTVYSSFGPEVEIVAPGGDVSAGEAGGVLSTLGPSSATYAFYQGTSMAAPHITGIISLMQSINPTLSRTAITQILQSTGVACGNCGGKPAVDAAAAVRAVPPPTSPPPDPVDPPPTTGDDNREENDVAGQEAVIACGARSNLMALAHDQDWFAVDAAPGSMTVSISGGANDLDLYVVRNGNEVVARSNGGTGDESITGNVDTAHRVVILVDPFSDANTGAAAQGPYTLSLDCTQDGAPPPDPVDPPPPDPTDPTDPTDPSDPTDPTDPTDPSDPTDPTDPGDPSGGDVDGPAAGGGTTGLVVDGGCAQTASSSTASAALPLVALLALARRRRR